MRREIRPLIVMVVCVVIGILLKSGFDRVAGDLQSDDQSIAAAVEVLLTSSPDLLKPTQLPTPTPTPRPMISVATEMAEKCCIVSVYISFADSGTYEVITMAGRVPAVEAGSWSNGIYIEVPVGKEWVGRVRVWDSTHSYFKETELIGEQFGWDTRSINMTRPVD